MLTHIENEITNVVKQQVSDTLREQIQALVADVISTGEIKEGSYSDKKYLLKIGLRANLMQIVAIIMLMQKLRN